MQNVDIMNSLNNIKNKSLPTKARVLIQTAEQKAIISLRDVNTYYAIHNCEPTMNRSNYREYELANRLQELRHRKYLYPVLVEHDEFNLLDTNPANVNLTNK